MNNIVKWVFGSMVSAAIVVAAFGLVANLQPSVKKRFLEIERARDDGLANMTFAECVYARMVAENGEKAMRDYVTLSQKKKRDRSRKERSRFRDLEKRIRPINFACHQPASQRQFAMAAIHHTLPLALKGWTSSLRKVGDKQVFFIKCEIVNLLHKDVAVVEGTVEFKGKDGKRLYAMEIENGTRIARRNTANVRAKVEYRPGGAEGESTIDFRDRSLRPALVVKTIAVGDDLSITY